MANKGNKKIYITGSQGLVGSRFVELSSKKFIALTPEIDELDITDHKALKIFFAKEKPDCVLHFAAYTDVNQAYEQRGNKQGVCYKVNVLGTRNIAQLSKIYSQYLIHISTDFVFDGKKKTAYTEADSPNPIEWYGQTKLWAEEEVKSQKGKYAIVRIAYPFRAYFPQKLDLVRTIYSKLKNGTLYPMFADQVITPTFIDDIAKAIDVFIRKKPQGIYHLVGSSSLSPYALAKKIARVFKLDEKQLKKGSLAQYLKTTKRPYQKYLALSNQKAKRQLGIRMSTIDQALRKIKKQGLNLQNTN